MAYKVLFLCTANSARSILFAATLNHLGNDRFEAHSAGSTPAGFVNPHALAELARRGITASDARSKSWDEYAGDARFDLVVTVCDNAANESCPVLFGDFIKAHWGLPDPAAIDGADAIVAEAFRRTEDVIVQRLASLIALPVESMPREDLIAALAAIEMQIPSQSLVEVAA